MKSLWHGTFLIEITQIKAEDRGKPIGLVVNKEREKLKVSFEGSLRGAIRYALISCITHKTLLIVSAFMISP